MLINALCKYYEILAQDGKVLPEGYSSVPVHQTIVLNGQGEIVRITSAEQKVMVKDNKGKEKEKSVPTDMIFPKRTEKPGIDVNFPEHRPLYLFGLNYDKDHLTPEDKTHKAEKSHQAFKERTLEFLEGLDSPLCTAFRAFTENWDPAKETENPYLQELGKKYASSSYTFSLEEDPDFCLNEDAQLRERWEKLCREEKEGAEDVVMGQCAVEGIEEPIARIHGKIKGVMGGLATGTVLVSYKNPAETSYGNEQSYNSGISESAMRKYTESLNYLLKDKKHRVFMEDMTVLFWAMKAGEKETDVFSRFALGNYSDDMDRGQTENMLLSLMRDAREGDIAEDRIRDTCGIDPEVDFYIVGLKPNSSRLSMKFLYHRKFGEILQNIALHQNDLQADKKVRTVPLWQINKQLISPKSKNETVNPALSAKLMEAMLYGRPYPDALLAQMVRRVKTDAELSVHSIRAGVIKACINRKARNRNQKEELTMGLNETNTNQAYLCGRLFAVLQKLQEEASNNSLNRTIKDAYFASAASKPCVVFPKLMKLAQNHLKKTARPVFFGKLMGEITNQLEDGFPGVLPLAEQGKFIVGYYQQYQSFFEKKEKQEEA